MYTLLALVSLKLYEQQTQVVTAEWFPAYTPSKIAISMYKCPAVSW